MPAESGTTPEIATPGESPRTEAHDARLDRLDAAVATARTRYEERQDLVDTDIGSLLETLNEEVGTARLEDADASHRRLDRVQSDLEDVEARLVEGVIPD